MVNIYNNAISPFPNGGELPCGRIDGTAWLGVADRGSIIHEVMEQYFSQTAPRVSTADESLLRKLVQDSVAKYKAKIPIPSNLKGIDAEVDSIIDVVIEEANAHANDSNRRTIGTEISFGNEEPLDMTFGPYTIHMKGRIDRVDQVEDGYEVIDYKSGRPRRFRRDFNIKLQYYLYTLAWEKLHPDQPIRRATYDLVDGIGGVEKKMSSWPQRARLPGRARMPGTGWARTAARRR